MIPIKGLLNEREKKQQLFLSLSLLFNYITSNIPELILSQDLPILELQGFDILICY